MRNSAIREARKYMQERPSDTEARVSAVTMAVGTVVNTRGFKAFLKK